MPTSFIASPRSTPAPFVITKGVKYIKINRTDEQGHDNTLSLQELTNVRLSLDDLGIVDFPVLTIAEYPDYYLYRVGPVILGDSTDKFKSPTHPSSSTDTYTLASGDNTSPIFYGYTDTTGSIGGTGLYNFPNGGYTVTTTCYFSASASPGMSKEIFYILFTGSNGITSKQFFNPNTGAGVVTGSYSASISYVPTSGSTLGIAFASGSININFNLPSIDFRITQDVTSSINNNILNHTFSASVYTTSSTTIPASSFRYITGSIFNVNSDILGYFNSSTGYYTFGDTPNVKITYAASAIFYATTTQSIIWGIGVDPLSNPGTVGASITVTSSLGQFSLITGSFVPLENGSYFLGVSNLSQTGTAGMDTVQWSFSQSVEPHSESRLTVLEPYLTTNFFYDDCNVLYGNADGLEYDVNFMSVNYDGNGGTVIPSNQQEILSNTAERAPVKSYNYRLLSQILPRYNGVKVIQQNENVWTIGDISPDKTPSVQVLENYIAYFDRIEDTNYVLDNQSSAHILYLIDKDGTVLTPSISSSYYYNLIYNFETGKNVNVVINSTSGNYQNFGVQPITRAGYIPAAIIASQTGSGYNSQNTMSFFSSGSTLVPNYLNTALGPSVTYGFDANGTISLTSATPSSPNVSFASSEFTIDTSTNLTDISLILDFPNGIQSSEQIGGASPTINVFIAIDEYNGAWATIASTWFNITYPSTAFPSISTPNFSPVAGRKYRCSIYNPSGYFYVVNNGARLRITQNNTPYGSEIYSGSGGLVYFTTGSSLKNVLTGSQFTNAIYTTPPLVQQNYPINDQVNPNSGYNYFIPFTLKSGDQIRFEGDENQLYYIQQINAQSGSASFNMVLDRDIVNGTNVNSFLIRRFIPHPNYVTLNAPASLFVSSSGFLFPEYITNELQQNFDTIIQNLKEKGLIPI
jgi:hypothetical protein